MGEYYNLLIEYRDGNKQHSTVAQKVYFVKTLPFINQLKTNRIIQNGMFRKEADIYSHIFMNSEMSKINGEIYLQSAMLIIYILLYRPKKVVPILLFCQGRYNRYRRLEDKRLQGGFIPRKIDKDACY